MDYGPTTEKLASHVESLCSALREHNGQEVLIHQDWLTGTVAAALMDQDAKAMRALRRNFTRLGSLADKYASGGPGERWRALSEVLQACGDTFRPMEQLRLANPDLLSGKALLAIAHNPGISQKELGDKLDVSEGRSSTLAKELEREGLTYRVKIGKEKRQYLAIRSDDPLAKLEPIKIVMEEAEKARRELPDAEVVPERDHTVLRIPSYASKKATKQKVRTFAVKLEYSSELASQKNFVVGAN
ncbi:MAG: helix-turn-helix domain-containing protein [Candidatus Thiodiazotropha sp.]